MKKVAIVVAHPDDEAFGCAGTIIKHKKKGDELFFLWMTNGVGARSSQSKAIDHRHEQHQSAIKFLEPSYYESLNYPDNQLDSVPFLHLVQSIEKFLSKVRPDLIYTHFFNDLNIDHALTCKAVITATRPGSTTFVRELYSFEVPSSTEWSMGAQQFVPDTYVDIHQCMKEKESYINCYSGELRPYPHPRSMKNIMALSQIRGAQVNLKYAESFITLKRIINE